MYVHVDMGAVGRKELFAGLGSKASINGGEDDITNRHMATTLVLLDARREVVLLYMSGAVPRSKEAHLAKVAIVGEINLRSEAKNFPVQDNSTRIISAVAMQKRQTYINDDSVKLWVC